MDDFYSFAGTSYLGVVIVGEHVGADNVSKQRVKFSHQGGISPDQLVVVGDCGGGEPVAVPDVHPPVRVLLLHVGLGEIEIQIDL